MNWQIFFLSFFNPKLVNPDSFYLLTPKSDKHLVSPYNITCDSHTKVTGIKQMIIK